MRTLIAHPDPSVRGLLASKFSTCRGPWDVVELEEIPEVLRHCGPYDAVVMPSITPQEVNIFGVTNHFGLYSRSSTVLPEASITVPLSAPRSSFVKRSFHAAMSANGFLYPFMNAGGLAVDARRQAIAFDGNPLDLTKSQFDILAELTLNRHKVLAESDLRQLLYSADNEPEGNTIEVQIARIRKAIQEAGGTGQEIATRRGAGFILADESCDDDSQYIEAGHISINEDTRIAYYDDNQIDLTAMEYKFLTLLATNQDRILHQKKILKYLYDDERRHDVDNNIADVFLCKVRKAIEKAGGDPNVIQTIHGQGYRLNSAEPLPVPYYDCETLDA